MVKHIVMFKLTEKTSENMELAINSLRSLEGKIETLKSQNCMCAILAM